MTLADECHAYDLDGNPIAEPIVGRHEWQADNHRIIAEYPFYLLSGRYCGSLTAQDTYAGLRWSHSLQAHGTMLFATEAEAMDDFYRVKQSLPAAVHASIFGAEG